MSCGGAAFAAGVLALAGAALADDDPRVWLDRMGEAVENLTYVGTFVHITDGEAETMRILHRVRDGAVTERLVSLDGSGREVIRNPQETKCILQAERAVLVEKRGGRNPLRATLPAYSSGLDLFYTLLYHGSDRVASRDTRVIEVRPRDAFRYGYRLWLDEETAMPLQSVLLSEAGETIERVLFTEISFPETIDDEALEPDISGEGFTWHVRSATLEGAASSQTTHWAAAEVPAGFELSVATTEPAEGGRTEEHLVYTDGLASVSVFVERMDAGEQPVNGLAAVGAANAFSTATEGHQITVVGEVPEETVRMIGRSVRPRTDPVPP